jgi:hypothetical protein
LSEENYFTYLESLLREEELTLHVKKAAQVIFDCISNKNSIWILGNGGSASTAEHFETDLYFVRYDKKSLKISHKSNEAVSFKIEIEPIGHSPWMVFKEVVVKPNETFEYTFAPDFQARWIRFSTNKNCEASTWLTYK